MFSLVFRTLQPTQEAAGNIETLHLHFLFLMCRPPVLFLFVGTPRARGRLTTEPEVQTEGGGDNPGESAARGGRKGPWATWEAAEGHGAASQWNLEPLCPFRLRTRSGLETPVWGSLAVAADHSRHLGDTAGWAEGAFRVGAKQQ